MIYLLIVIVCMTLGFVIGAYTTYYLIQDKYLNDINFTQRLRIDNQAFEVNKLNLAQERLNDIIKHSTESKEPTS